MAIQNEEWAGFFSLPWLYHTEISSMRLGGGVAMQGKVTVLRYEASLRLSRLYRSFIVAVAGILVGAIEVF